MKRLPISEAIGRKYPEPVVLVVTVDDDGRPNVMPAGWNTITSGDPLMLAVSIGLERHTHSLLSASETFVVTFPSIAQKEAILFCGSNSGADVNKIAESSLETVPADEVSAPLLADAAACFECRKHDSLQTGDHTLFVGEVVAAHGSETYDERVVQIGKQWDGTDRFRSLSELLDGQGSTPGQTDDRPGLSTD